ncbi:MAG: ATP-binding protein [Chitinophagaceae bacterium]
MLYDFDYFIRSNYKRNPYIYRKAKLLVKTSFLTSIFSTFYLVITIILDMHYGSIAMIYNVISFLLIPFLFRWGVSGLWASNLYILTGAIGVGICVATQNSIETATIIWFALLPVVSLMLSNRLSAWIWTIIAYSTVVVFGMIHQKKLILINEVPPEYNVIFEVSNITGFILIVFLVVLVFQKTTDNTLETISEKNRLLEREKQRSEQAFEELKATQKQLIQSEKMASLGELTAGIAHEIQNPLNFVNNFSEVSTELVDEMQAALDKDEKQEAREIAVDIKQILEKITHHGKRADSIVKGMLLHSRTSTGKKEPTDINALADEYLRLSYHGLRAKDKTFNANFKTDFDESLEKIEVIPQDLGRVLLNLYNNAFYSVNEKKKQLDGAFEPEVSVSTKRSAGKVEICVKDNGVGISKQVLDKIYQPFYTTKPTGQGTGLGLSMSYDIVKAHGGEIKVETKQGEYAKFIVELPAK